VEANLSSAASPEAKLAIILGSAAWLARWARDDAGRPPRQGDGPPTEENGVPAALAAHLARQRRDRCGRPCGLLDQGALEGRRLAVHGARDARPPPARWPWAPTPASLVVIRRARVGATPRARTDSRPGTRHETRRRQ
jgi:hypothetical protein